MRVVPIVAPQINWDGFVTESYKVLGRSPTASLDVAGITPGSLKTFICSLGEFESEGTAPVPFLQSRGCDKSIEHISFSFLIINADICGVLKLGKPSVLVASNRAALMSGSLRQWREILIEGCRTRCQGDTLSILSEIYRHFLCFGLHELFAMIELISLKDGNYLLELRK